MSDILSTLRDPWVLFGFLAQGIFFMRFVVQWYVSEKKKESVIPIGFWYLSIVGAVMIAIYSFHIGDPVFSAASVLSIAIYVRNLFLIKKKSDGTA